MIFTSKNKNSIILQCSAMDFDSIQFDIEDFSDDNIIMSITTLSPDFYTLQSNTPLKILWRRIRLALSILFGKEFVLYDIVLTKDDFLEFKNFINNTKL